MHNRGTSNQTANHPTWHTLRRTTLAVYSATCVLGLGLQRGWWHTRGFGRLHHALFGAIWLSTIATALAGWQQRQRAWWAPLAVLLWMAPLPRFRAGGTAHHVLSGGGGATLLAALWATRAAQQPEEPETQGE